VDTNGNVLGDAHREFVSEGQLKLNEPLCHVDESAIRLAPVIEDGRRTQASGNLTSFQPCFTDPFPDLPGMTLDSTVHAWLAVAAIPCGENKVFKVSG
jgi:hypothetical protein